MRAFCCNPLADSSSAPRRETSRDRSTCVPARSLLQAPAIIVIAASLLVVGAPRISAQNQSPTPGQPESLQQSTQQNSAASPSAQKPDRVTTTVVVHGEVKDDYLSGPHTAAGLDDTP